MLKQFKNISCKRNQWNNAIKDFMNLEYTAICPENNHPV